MKPEDLLNPADFPDDLKWVPAHYKLHPSDPVYLLIAWHWRRVKQSEDTMKAAIVELKAALDGRLGVLEQGTETVAGINDALVELQETFESTPERLGSQLEAKLAHPVARSLAQLQALEKSVAPLAAAFAVSQRRQLLASLLTGVCLGVLSAVIVLLA